MSQINYFMHQFLTCSPPFPCGRVAANGQAMGSLPLPLTTYSKCSSLIWQVPMIAEDFLFRFLYALTLVCTACAHNATAHMQRPEKNFWESFLFYFLEEGSSCVCQAVFQKEMIHKLQGSTVSAHHHPGALELQMHTSDMLWGQNSGHQAC